MSSKISSGGVKKTRNEGLKIITANRLMDGAVVYFSAHHGWTMKISGATIYEGDDALAGLASAVADEANVVGPYLMDVADENGRMVPDGRGRLRELIRDLGPTIHPQFGRQANGEHPEQEAA